MTTFLGGGYLANQAGSAATIPVPFDVPTSAGSFLVAAFSWDEATGPVITSVDDDIGNTWVPLTKYQDATNAQNLQLAYCLNATGSVTTVTANMSPNAAARRGAVAEYADAAISFDKQAGASGAGNTGTDAVTTGLTAATDTADELIISGVIDTGGGGNPSAGTGFTRRGTGTIQVAIEDRVLASPGTVAGTWTFTLSHRWAVAVATFRVAVPTAPVVSIGEDSWCVVGGTFGRVAVEDDTGDPITAREWKVMSGPADAGDVIGTDVVNTWAPSETGSYVLRYTATNGIGASFDELNLEVGAAVEGPQNSSLMRR